jgi:transglutaminase-like putative cysteine protease
LENPTVTKAITQVVLPPDTAYQKIYFDDITPKPIEIEIDEDGNWLATFDLEPKEKITAVAKGSAVLYLEPVVPIINGKADLSKYLLPQKYWPVNDSQIKNLADELETPKKIYEYIVNNFAYNYDRINGKTGRLGAKEAFNNPQNSICTEFTDAFISLSRAAGIPAREVNGFAYTENSKLKPLSLVADVLHAWPEYYDENRNLWVPVDPTWGNTTGGIDYFSNLDFNHFTLAIHGTNSEKPYPAGYYKFEGEESKDIYIEFSQQTPQEKLSFDVDFGEAKNSFLSGKAKVDLTITNNSNVAVYNLPINLTSEGLKLSSESRVLVPVLLPFDLVTVPVDILNGTKKPTLRVEINGQIYEAEIKISQASDLPIIAIGIVLGSAVGFLSYRAGSLLVSFFRKRGALRR